MSTLKSMRLHIGIFGRTNVGKSSLLNRITNQEVSIVSDVAGTTTDVVEKSMELLPIGPVTFIDTAGLDDESTLSSARIEKAYKALNRTDIGILVCDKQGFGNYEISLTQKFNELKIPFVVVFNKIDTEDFEHTQADMWKVAQIQGLSLDEIHKSTPYVLFTSVKTDRNLVVRVKETLVKILPEDFINQPKIVGDLVPEKSTVVLVVPIDKEAPKGRIILPQVQVLRDLLDSNCKSVVVKESELREALEGLKTPPALVITDSQAFRMVAEIVPESVPLTSFSILFARLKGDVESFAKGAQAIENLKDGDKVLILESCTHHAIEDDIGRVKIPKLLTKKTGKKLIFDNISGHDFPDVGEYALVVHCGACMTNRREVLSRIFMADKKGVPMTNYGIAISYCLGILPRALKIFY